MIYSPPKHPTFSFQHPKKIPTCITTIPKNLTRKLFFETLCLKINMAKTSPAVPPKNVMVSKENSEILLLCFTAFHLSIANAAKVIRLIIANRYNMKANLKQKINMRKRQAKQTRPHKSFYICCS